MVIVVLVSVVEVVMVIGLEVATDVGRVVVVSTIETLCESYVGSRDDISDIFGYRVLVNPHVIKKCHCKQISYSTLINFFNFAVDTSFLEDVLEVVSVETMRKLIMKNRHDQRSHHFHDSVY